MPVVHLAPVAGFSAVLLLLAGLAATVGLGASGWVVGLLCAASALLLVGLGMTAYGVTRLGPADRVTLTRLVLAIGVAALTAAGPLPSGPSTVLVGIATVALVLDAVDGRVARRSGTASAFGARFDGECDAFLILVLSVYVSRSVGAWVLLIGAARYAFLTAGGALPWMRATLPPRYWRKVVAAVQGIVLTVAASGVLPLPQATAALVVAAALLAESFGRDVLWLWQRRKARVASGPRPDGDETSPAATGLGAVVVAAVPTSPASRTR